MFIYKNRRAFLLTVKMFCRYYGRLNLITVEEVFSLLHIRGVICSSVSQTEFFGAEYMESHKEETVNITLSCCHCVDSRIGPEQVKL